jgi:hypothetical protein
MSQEEEFAGADLSIHKVGVMPARGQLAMLR